MSSTWAMVFLGAVEIAKLALQQKEVRDKLAGAGVSPEALDAALAEARAKVAALPSAETLPEV